MNKYFGSIFSIMSLVALMAVTFSCENVAPVATTPQSGTTVLVEVPLGQASRGVFAEASSIAIEVTNATSAVVGSGNLVKGSSNWSASLTVTETGALTFSAQVKNAAGKLVYWGSAPLTTTGTNDTVTIPVTATPDYTLTGVGTLKVVPPGRFQRDATATNIAVITKPYRMSEKEITRTQFLAVMGTDPSNTTYSSGTTDPVQKTNWYHAIAFCNKLSLAENLTPVYTVSTVSDWSALTFATIPTTSNADWDAAIANWSANGYRLPTEMEWMWAAMGATGSYTKAFSGSTGSNAIGDYAVYDYWGTGLGKTTTARSNPVGSKLPNDLGLYDMSGNVWEHCWDWNAAYSAGTVKDDKGPATVCLNRVLRGGAWGYNYTIATVAERISDFPAKTSESGGFRVVRP